ncbi:L-histidine N(alpha)-methyltransferase [Patescibacteria group bacterium]|nr:L-histidine N(alpha)-methyltransferase [Patescibacteria group bacterium]
MEKSILTIKQAAKLLQVDPNTIYRWARAGKFPGSKIGKEWRILHSDVIKFIESHKVRHQFLSEAQEAELITALIGRREIPLKFQYFGKGADRYTSFQHPKEYGGESELEILTDNQKKLVNFLGNDRYSLVDLGCGDGKKAAYFISHLDQKINGYFALDLSLRMLDIANNNMELAHPALLKETFRNDFEQGNIANVTYYLHRRYQKPNLLLFVGQTIGNISDAHRVLINIAESMTDDDRLIVGLAYYNAENIPAESYNLPEAIEVMWTMPELIVIKRTDAKIYWTWNKTRRQLECQLEFLKDWSQTFGSNLLKFPKGQRIRLAISRRFTRDDIFELFANAGFKIESLFIDKEKSNALVLCKSHSWERQV